MKKLVSVLLALLILVLPVLGSAEEAAVAENPFEKGILVATRIDDPVVDLMGQTIDLTGLNVSFAAGAGQNGGLLELHAGAGEKTLGGVRVEFTADGIYFTGDGMTDVYYLGYTDLLNLIDPELAVKVGEFSDVVKAFIALYTEENLADFTARMQAAAGEIGEIIGNGMSQEAGEATVNGAAFSGTRTVFSYDGEAIRSILTSVVKMYEENPGFKAYMDAVMKLTDSEPVSFVEAVSGLEINETVSGETFSSEGGDAWMLTVNTTNGTDTETFDIFYTMGEAGLVFGLNADVDGDKLELNGAFADALNATCTVNGEKQFDLSAAPTEYGAICQVKTAYEIVECTIGGEKTATVVDTMYEEKDFSYATVADTMTLTLDFGATDNGFNGELSYLDEYPDGTMTKGSILLNAVLTENELSLRLDTVDEENLGVITSETAETAGDSEETVSNVNVYSLIGGAKFLDNGIEITFRTEYNGEADFEYDYLVTVDGDKLTINCAENMAGLFIKGNYDAQILENNAVSGKVTAEAGYADETMLKLDLNEAYSVSEMPELTLAGTQDAKNVVDILAAGEDSAQFSAFIMNWYSLAMNAAAGFEEAFPEVIAMFAPATEVEG